MLDEALVVKQGLQPQARNAVRNIFVLADGLRRRDIMHLNHWGRTSFDNMALAKDRGQRMYFLVLH